VFTAQYELALQIKRITFRPYTFTILLDFSHFPCPISKWVFHTTILVFPELQITQKIHNFTALTVGLRLYYLIETMCV
jgi:hypothetical protein